MQVTHIDVPARVHYMDAMRSVLMLLGLVLHSARPYDSGSWRVNDTQTSAVFDALTWVVHLFRMPAFFVVAGYFTMLLLARRTTSVFLRERMGRVGVPFLATLLSANLVQSWYLGRSRATGLGGFIEDVLLPDFWSGKLTGHLWFLVCLATYFLIAAVLAPTLRRLTTPDTKRAPLLASALTFHLMLAAAVLAPLALGVAARLTTPFFSQIIFGLISLSDCLFYLPFFAVGAVLFASPAMLDRFASHGLMVIAFGLAGALGVYLTSGQADVVGRALHIVARSLLVWMAVRVVFSLFRRWARKASSIFQYLSDASYSIYLVHQLVVVVAATLMLGVETDAWIKFLVVLTTASLVSLAVHHFLVRPYAPMRYLFNGRPIGKRQRGYSPEPALSKPAGT